jgi:putative aldouronate transport system substrate-binding protein
MKWGLKSKGALAAVLATTLVLAGCSGGANEAPAASGNNAAAGGSTEFNLWLGWSATINNDSSVQKYWKENEPGVAVTLEATQGDAATALNLKLNTGGFKDAAIFSRSETVESAMQRSKKIMSLEQYFDMPDKYPGLASIPKEYLEEMKDENGQIWSIPTWFDQNPDNPWPGWASQTWLVRTDVLEKVGMTLDDLATLEGVEEYLKAAASVKDDAGKTLNPMGFLMDPSDTIGWNDENAILSAFGVTTGSAGGVVPVAEKNGEFVLLYDDPQFKAAYQWLNEMYLAKLIDPEVVTDKKERYKEKNKSGRTALNVGSFFNVDATLWETLDGPTEPAWFYQVVPFPKVEGVDQVGANQVVNPYPGYDVYVSKDSKNLEAILKFFDYTLQPNAEQQQVINEGPAGVFWDWVDQPLGEWKYVDEAYKTERNSGDVARKSTVTPELYMASSYNNDWYPWWNYGEADKAGAKRTSEFTSEVGAMGGVRGAEPYDMVKAVPGGLWEKYGPELENVRKEYRAKLVMAKDAAQFETAWNQFRDALEKRAHWSELKEEWQTSYDAMLAKQ